VKGVEGERNNGGVLGEKGKDQGPGCKLNFVALPEVKPKKI